MTMARTGCKPIMTRRTQTIDPRPHLPSHPGLELEQRCISQWVGAVSADILEFRDAESLAADRGEQLKLRQAADTGLGSDSAIGKNAELQPLIATSGYLQPVVGHSMHDGMR